MTPDAIQEILIIVGMVIVITGFSVYTYLGFKGLFTDPLIEDRQFRYRKFEEKEIMNMDNCKECNSTLEQCLRIQCLYWMNIKRDEKEDEDVMAESEDAK